MSQTTTSSPLRPSHVQKQQTVVLVFKLLHSKNKGKKKIANHKVPKETFHFIVEKKKKKNSEPLLTVDFQTTTAPESPRWRSGVSTTVEVVVGGVREVKGGQPQVQRKQGVFVQQNKKQKDRRQVSSPRLLVRLAVRDLRPP